MGVYAGNGTLCSDLPKPCKALTGACCGTGSTCFSGRTKDSCDLIPGVFAGLGTSCADTPPICLSVTGVCCLWGSPCTDGRTFATCGSDIGIFAGEGTRCAVTPDICALGACCIRPGVCQDYLIRLECDAAGGTFTPGVLCRDTGC